MTGKQGKAWKKAYRAELIANNPGLPQGVLETRTGQAWAQCKPILEQTAKNAAKNAALHRKAERARKNQDIFLEARANRYRKKHNSPAFALQRHDRVTHLYNQVRAENPKWTGEEVMQQAKVLENNEIKAIADQEMRDKRTARMARKAEMAARRAVGAKPGEARMESLKGKITNYFVKDDRALQDLVRADVEWIEDGEDGEDGGEEESEYEPPESLDYEPPDPMEHLPEGLATANLMNRPKHEPGSSNVLAAYEQANTNTGTRVARDTPLGTNWKDVQRKEAHRVEAHREEARRAKHEKDEFRRAEIEKNRVRRVEARQAVVQKEESRRAEVQKDEAHQAEARRKKVEEAQASMHEARLEENRRNKILLDEARIARLASQEEIRQAEELRRERLYRAAVKSQNIQKWFQRLTEDEPEAPEDMQILLEDTDMSEGMEEPDGERDDDEEMQLSD